MSDARVKKRGRPSKRGTTEPSVSPMSLPPSGSDAPVPASTSPSEDTATDQSTDQQTEALVPAPEKPPYWKREKKGKAYEQCMRILAMRAAGFEDKRIAEALNLALQSVHNYCYMAGKNGWITDQLMNARDTVEYKILPKAMRVLEEGLSDSHRNDKTGMQVKTTVALKIAEGTVFRKYEQSEGGAQANNIFAIRIEMPPGAPQQMRPGTTAGAPAYIDVDAEAVHVGNTGLQPRDPEV